MKRISIIFIMIVVCALIFSSSVPAAKSPPAKGAMLPDINLTVPATPWDRSYLGLPASRFFKIPQVRAKIVIVEIFSMYCPFCQREAPRVNKLYRMIEDNPNLKNKIKLIGIGAGNSSYEVEIFRKTYDIPFPLFADGDYSIHKILGEVRTPYFIGVKINNNGTQQIFYSELGGIKEPDKFLELILRLLDLKQGGAK